MEYSYGCLSAGEGGDFGGSGSFHVRIISTFPVSLSERPKSQWFYIQRPPLIFLWPPRSWWDRVLASRLLGVCLYSLRIWRINVLRLDFDECCKLLKSRCLERFMFCSLASLGRCCGEFLNNGRAEFCEMWNSRLDSASFGILRAAARFCLGFFSFPSGLCLILYVYDLFMS